MVDVVFTGMDGAGERDIALTLRADALVGDVIHALAGTSADVTALVVDGRAYRPEMRMRDVSVCPGSSVGVTAVASRQRERGRPPASVLTAAAALPALSCAALAVVEVRVIAGLDAGYRFLLPPGHFVIGRAGADGVDVPLASDTVSARHAVLTVDVSGICRLRDLGSRNGVRIERSFVRAETTLAFGAVVEVGAMELVVTAVTADDTSPARAVGSAGVIAFDRMPRTLVNVESLKLRPPPAPAEGDLPPRLSWAAVLVPLAIAALLVVLMPRNSMLVVFMALSPVLAIVTWGEERRRSRSRRSKEQADYRRAVASFAAEVEAARLHELRELRRAAPDLAETVRRARAPSTSLWQRRPGHDDFGVVAIGTADLPWRPLLSDHAEPPAEASAVLAGAGVLSLAPVDCALIAGRCIGVVGSRGAAISVVRAMLAQAAVHHGPADLAIAVLTEPARVPDWEWTKWLPHSRPGSSARLLAGNPADRQALVATVQAGSELARHGGGRLHLVVMDADGITAGRSCPPRDLLNGAAGPLAAIVVADRVDQLPGACTDIVEVLHPDGIGRYTRTAGGVVTDVQLTGLSAATAQSVGRALARYEDADLVEPGAGLPVAVPFRDLFEVGALTAAGIESRWRRRTAGLATTVGATADGPLVVDLVRDGPHGLIAGTTGAGKSELLRTILASIAVSHSPRDVTFLLIDYKGGSAFAECARLPHTVGVVTDLDERLGARALTCLEAELRHRERVLRDAGATDLPDYVAAGEQGGALPRLVVAIDEFATLAAELPDFIDALVDVAQRGRSLGVHLLLATQRPRGAVKDNIRANSNLRIALRAHDAADSADVLDSSDAADISRAHPGRALLRLGPGELLPFQSGYVSGTSMAPAAGFPPVEVRPFTFGPAASSAVPACCDAIGADSPSDLARVVDAAVIAANRLALGAARRPWPDPLRSQVLLAEIPQEGTTSAGWSVEFGLADEPERQRQVAYSWQSAAGGLLLYGVAGSGTSTALAALSLALARRYSATDMHVYVLDFGNQLLAPLRGLPHVGAVLGPNDRDRQERLIRRLRTDVARRQVTLAERGADGINAHNAVCAPGDRLGAIVLMIDNWSALSAAYDDLPGLAVRDQLARIVADGPGLGIFTVIAADRVTAVPASIAGLIAQKLVFRLSDPHDFGAFGIPARGLPSFVPGRAIDVATRREIQIALPDREGIAAAVAAALSELPRSADNRERLPAPVLTLPDAIEMSEVAARPRIEQHEWWLPFGIGDRALEPVGLRLAEGEHVLVAGGARAGKSSLLLALGRAAATAGSARTIVIASPRSPLCQLAGAHIFGTDDEECAVQLARVDDSPCLLLVDDAERVDDTPRAIRGLLEQRRSRDRVIAAGRADALRASYGHWTQELRRSRQGIVLKPNPDVDGDLWGMLLPRRGPSRFSAGRGYLVVDGEAELVQVARP